MTPTPPPRATRARTARRCAAIAGAAVIMVLLGACGASGDTSNGGSATAGTPAPPPADPCAARQTPVTVPGGDAFCDLPSSTTVGANGLQYGDLVVGTGPALSRGERLRVQYTGWLQSTGAMFDSSRQPGRQPFEFTLGAGEVIPGWDQGLAGMKVGGKRRLVIPPGLAYGARGHSPTIPPNATLVFDVEVLSAG